MTDSSNVRAGEASVFCQISGREISPKSCSQTQGQDACFGCAASTRRCEKCNLNFVTVAATGTCSQCTATEIEDEKAMAIPAPPAKVSCQMQKRLIGGTMCRSIQGQDGCRGCAATSRMCEKCEKRPVRFPQYGFCFTCSVNEYGEGWKADDPDQSVHHLRVVPPGSVVLTDEPTQEIELLAKEFIRIPLANIRDPERPVRTKKPDEQDLFDLGDSMLNDKMIYPVIVEPVTDNFYEVLIGSRRTRAARLKGMLDIPALVVSPQSPLIRILLALSENIHRVNLDPLEEAQQFLRLMREHSFDTSGLAGKIRRPTQYVKERLQLLSLPEDVQKLVSDGELSIRNAASLARIPDAKRQAILAREAVTHRFAPNELRRRVTSEFGGLEETARVIPYHVTPQKFAARSDEFTGWFKRALPRLRLGETTLEERVLMLGSLTGLETQIAKIKEKIQKEKSANKKKSR